MERLLYYPSTTGQVGAMVGAATVVVATVAVATEAVVMEVAVRAAGRS